MMGMQFIMAAIATISFMALFQTPSQHYLFAGLIGGVGWIVNLSLLEVTSPAMACFIATLILTLMARMACISRRTPVTVFLTAGIFPLVPGAGIYYTAYHLFTGSMETAGRYGLETLVAAGSIALGIVFGFAVPQRVFVQLIRVFHRNREREG